MSATSTNWNNNPDLLEQDWMQVQDEIDAEELGERLDDEYDSGEDTYVEDSDGR